MTGVFESMRSLNGNIVGLDAHLKRLILACRALNIKPPVSSEQLKNEIRRGVKSSGFKDNRIRVSSLKNRHKVLIEEYKAFPQIKYSKGFYAGIAGWRQDERSPLAQIKVTERARFDKSYRAAKSSGFDEAVILNSLGYVTEGTRSNIFMVKRAELFTPALECGCLNGITRRIILGLAKKAKIKTFETKLTLKDLADSDEAFLTNSLMGVMPLTVINGLRINNGRPGKLTRWFIKKYNSLLK